jgi:hypothetical protein
MHLFVNEQTSYSYMGKVKDTGLASKCTRNVVLYIYQTLVWLVIGHTIWLKGLCHQLNIFLNTFTVYGCVSIISTVTVTILSLFKNWCLLRECLRKR